MKFQEMIGVRDSLPSEAQWQENPRRKRYLLTHPMRCEWLAHGLAKSSTPKKLNFLLHQVRANWGGTKIEFASLSRRRE